MNTLYLSRDSLVLGIEFLWYWIIQQIKKTHFVPSVLNCAMKYNAVIKEKQYFENFNDLQSYLTFRHCLISNREGLGTSLPSLVLIRLVLTEIQRFKNVKINKEMYGIRYTGRTASGWPSHFFVNFDIFKWLYLAYFLVYLHQPWGFCKAFRIHAKSYHLKLCHVIKLFPSHMLFNFFHQIRLKSIERVSALWVVTNGHFDDHKSRFSAFFQ